jgi:hypothetical protein
VRLRASLKCRVHALIARHGILPSYGELFGKAGGRFLEALPSCATLPGAGSTASCR